MEKIRLNVPVQVNPGQCNHDLMPAPTCLLIGLSDHDMSRDHDSRWNYSSPAILLQHPAVIVSAENFHKIKGNFNGALSTTRPSPTSKEIPIGRFPSSDVKTYLTAVSSALGWIKNAITEAGKFTLLRKGEHLYLQGESEDKLGEKQVDNIRYPSFLLPFLPLPERSFLEHEDPPTVIRCRVGYPNPKRLRPGEDNMEERLCNKHSREVEFNYSMMIHGDREQRVHAWKCA